jgi:hypothetical protein
MDRHRGAQFLNELEPLRFSHGRVRAGCSMSEFDERHHRERDLHLADFTRDSGQHLTGILALTFCGHKNTGIED